MPAFAHILVAASYTAVAVFLGVAVYQFTPYSLEMSAIAGLIFAFIGGQVHIMALSRERSKLLENSILSVKNDVRKTKQRTEIMETRVNVVEETLTREVAERREELVSEMRELEDLIQRLGKSFEAKLSKQTAEAASGAPVAGKRPPDQTLRAVQDALDANRVDLHLQPIVTLPQRRVCFYEGFTRLRDERDQLIMPGDFIGPAKDAGLLGVIDNMLLFRCVQIVRRLSEKDRRVGVFCNIGASSLEDDSFFPQFLEFIKENRDLSGSLIFEMGFRDFQNRSSVTARNMGRLADLGFRFSIDKADSLEVDLPELQGEAVKFLKIEGRKLIEQMAPGGPRPISSVTREIEPSDICAVFMRYGVDLIADKVETERDVVEILDYDIPFGQGHVFGTPRPIKGTLMEETAPPADFLKRAV
jgi:cyclic-di-GMP phosphodiesterase TipF (flagellum assembly factor)